MTDESFFPAFGRVRLVRPEPTEEEATARRVELQERGDAFVEKLATSLRSSLKKLEARREPLTISPADYEKLHVLGAQIDGEISALAKIVREQ